ncbi:TPR and ankyrin repeat-containing protein 1-like [Patiria miniata]|uniref:UvrD-like helicase ATP-binding domain-containing protein n=1 Tax=Patiria miniata TaxID=46514 RepID=A0A914BHP5_PATMI|nr:TPR and ankyrin repeat-containing protein 1-like [Patiria miniata]
MERRKCQKQQGEAVERKKSQKSRQEERRRPQQSEDGKTAIDPNAFDHLIWEVELAQKVWEFLRDKKNPRYIKETAIRKIQTLATGDWHRGLSKRFVGSPCDIKLYETNLTKAGRILWERTVVFSPRLTSTEYEKMLESDDSTQIARYSEVIRVWDIVLDHSKVPHAIEVITQAVKGGQKCKIRKSLERIDKGKASRGTNESKNLSCCPAVFRVAQSAQHASNDMMLRQWCPPAVDEYRIMKMYSFTSMLVNAVLKDSQLEVEFPFRVTELEHAIINLQPEPPSSILLLGRSGTGKTTCCLYRMWTRFVRYWQNTSEGPCWIPRDSLFTHLEMAEEVTETHASIKKALPNMDHLHQIFVTRSPKLCAEVQRSFCNMVRGCQFAEEPLSQLDRPMPHRLQDVHQAQFPLFLTSRQLLLLLDASLPNPFFPREADGSLELNQGNKFSCNHPHRKKANRRGLVEKTKFDLRSEVTYEVFAKELWPCINKKKLKCHPSLVWTEITSFIKGSFEALHSETGFLSLEEYLDIGKKMAPNFSTDREEIYNIFKMYKHGNQQKNLFDEGDLVFHVYRRLCEFRRLEWAIHEFYVDETQDFTQAELSLLIQCAQDPNSLFLTGDTAQSIMRGVAFRFKDLKSLFYYANQSVKVQGKSSAVSVPKNVYHLTYNYRSHSGILNLAATVVDILGHFFPLSFDRLLPDQGLFDGPLPVILATSNVNNLPSLLQKSKNHEETSGIDFGADQVILVASASVKQQEKLAMFDKGIVMTIEEAKGLEFNDVLLYNFFKDSGAGNMWRVITGYKPGTIGDQQREHLEKTDLQWLCSTNPSRPLDFNPDEHKVLNSELKRLYTAITRARNNVWIFDEDEKTPLPMFELFCSNGLVEVAKPEDVKSESYTGFVKPSSPSEWKERAKYYTEKDSLEAAEKCAKLAADQEEKERIRAEKAAAEKRQQEEEQRAEKAAAVEKKEQARREEEAESAVFDLASSNVDTALETVAEGAWCGRSF